MYMYFSSEFYFSFFVGHVRTKRNYALLLIIFAILLAVRFVINSVFDVTPSVCVWGGGGSCLI